MKRTTVTLPDEILEALERAARRGHTSVSEVVRGMLAAQLGLIAGGARPLPFAGVGRSGKRHLAHDMEVILREEWTADRDR